MAEEGQGLPDVKDSSWSHPHNLTSVNKQNVVLS